MKNLKFSLLALLVIFLTSLKTLGQTCPHNIDFSLGYGDWNYYEGTCSNPSVTAPYTWNWATASYGVAPPIMPSPPASPIGSLTQIVNASTILSTPASWWDSSDVIIAGGLDYFGRFPVVPPPRAGFPTPTSSLLLNGPLANLTISKAEYIFTPSSYGVTTLGYQYAVVMQNPGHTDNQNPRFTVVATDTVTGDTVGCTGFNYIAGIYAGSPVPFTLSPYTYHFTDVYYLPWQAGTINLSSVPAGHPVRIAFMVGSCSLYHGHMAYAYISMACSTWQDTIRGCYPGTVTLPLPPSGDSSYTWYRGTTPISTTFTPTVISIPTPSVTTTYTVVMDPYAGFGCSQTLTVTVVPSPTPVITGPSILCSGTTTTLSSSVSGGVWTSSNPGVNIPYSFTGVIEAWSDGITSVITNTSPAGCVGTFTVTVPRAGLIGPGIVCEGQTISLSFYDGTTTGTWSSSDNSLATVNNSGVVTGVGTGNVYITGISPVTGCPATAYIFANDPIITSSTSVCSGATLTGTLAGGTWTSGNTSIATVSPGGVVTAVGSGGTVAITYTFMGCVTTKTVTVSLPPGPITGPTSVCAGSHITLSDSGVGAWWISNNNSIATVDVGTGIVTGVAAGTDVIDYMLPSGCYTTTTVTVLAVPGAVTGTDSVCVGNTTTLSDAISPGIWSSSSTSVATVVLGTGVVTGVSAGTTSITYTLTDGCGSATATVTVKVDPLPDPITGATLVCAGSTITLSDGTPDGTWTSNTTSIATIGSSTGVTYGVGMGTTPITYALSTGCYATASVTVNPTPVILGPMNVCTNAGISLSSDISDGSWTSSTTSVATITPGSGFLSAVSVGTTVITYTLGTGCMATTTVTVNISPDVIIGSGSVCAGSTIVLSDDVPGGSWSSGNTGIATVDGTGIVTGVSAGPAIITYAIGSCITTSTVMVNITPSIYGSSDLCTGTIETLSDDHGGGTWTSSNTGIATIDGSGVIGGILTGTITITYTLSDGCSTTLTVTVEPVPDPISGATEVCIGSGITLSDDTPGGVWTSSNTTVATVGSSTGIVTGVATGTANITYTTGHCFATYSVTVDQPLLVDFSGPDLYQGCPINLTGHVNPIGSPATVMWSSSNTSVATVSPVFSYTTTVTGGVVGTTTITFSATNACGVATWTVSIGVQPLPILTIGGPVTVCAGTAIVLSSDPGYGTWSSSETTVATVDPITQYVMGVNPGGISVLTDSLELYTGCVLTATTTITVNPQPDPITGITEICIGNTSILSDDIGGGTWSSHDPFIATIGSSSGVVTGLAAGLTAITYTGPSGGCFTITGFTVDPLPSTITGDTSICLGSGTTLSDATLGGTWSSSDGTVATIGTSSGVVTSVAVGTTIITYQLVTGCIATRSVTVVVPASVVDISGRHSFCVGNIATLSDSPGGGVWSSSNTLVATIDPATGVMTAIAVGSTTITYAVTNACGTSSITTSINVFTSTPLPITGITSVCLGGSTTLSNATTGGTWSSSNGSVATIDPVTGIVTSVGTGTTTISYVSTNDGGCVTTATVIVTVNPLPTNITGSSTVCVGSTINLSDGTTGGAWVSSNTIMATVDGFGTVTGVSGGIVTISYTLSTGCQATYTLTVLGPPAVINSVLGICSGNTTTLSNIVGGGTWSSSNTAIATVDPVTGVITGVTTGLATITYAASGVCGTFSVTATVSVNMPPYITTNFIVACQALGGHEEFTHILNDSAGCIDVCENRVIRYYGNGVIGSVFSWAISGGTIVYNYGDSIDVIWPTAGTTCSISLFDSAGGCSGVSTVCLRIISGPHAAFSPSEVSVCLNSSVSFTDISTADPLSPIISWYWNFGDGDYSSIENPTHTFTTANNHDTVSLVVTNACGCTDTFKMRLKIKRNEGPLISCPSIVCDSEIATYTIPNTGCTGSYMWSVDGGTIVSGAGTTSITVAWNNVDPTGYGYVNAVDPCAACPDTTTIKIPVILKTDTITGPDVICTGNQYEYSLPLWPATQYMWGVPGEPSAIHGYHDDYHVTLNFSTPGTYNLHGWYQNTIKLCGANLFKQIKVYPSTTISGPTSMCAGTTPTYTVDGLNAHWVVSDAATGTVLGTHTGTMLTYTTTPVGSYIISATGHFCVDPIIITIHPNVVSVDSVKGPDTVCLNRVYTYIGYGIAPLSWHASGGFVSVSSGCDTVNVTWTASGPKQLTVSSAAGCGSAPITMNVQQELINPVITGNTTPCANSHQTYSTAYTRAEVYDWSIFPTTAGSVVSGDHTPGINVLWNNVSGTSLLSAGVVVTVRKCDSVIKDTLMLSISSPTVGLSGSISPVCPGAVVTYTASAGGSHYGWVFGDGTSANTTSNVTTHIFPSNTTSSNVTYPVTVTVMPDVTYACPSAGVATLSEVVLPGPVVNPSYGENLCVDPTTVISGNETDIGGTFTYQWYEGGTPISGATDENYTATTPDTYTLVVVAGDGCTAQGSVGVPGCGLPGCGTVLTATVTTTGCNQITVAATTGSGINPVWVAQTPPSSGLQTVTFGAGGVPGVIISTTFTYDVPGIYHFEYREDAGGGCDNQADVYGEIDVAPRFTYNISCAPGGVDNVTLTDNSAFLTGWGVTTVNWSDAAGSLGPPGTPLTVALPAPFVYVVSESVVFTSTTAATFTCVATNTITLPAQPTSADAEFTYATSPICEAIPITFTPVTTGANSYSWDFGDLSSSLLQNTQRTYTWGGPSNPQFNIVTLTISDGLGCSASASHTMQIQENTMNGGLGGNQIVCSHDAPATLTFAPAPLSYTVSPPYLWSTGAATTTNSISVNTSGAYWVTVVGLYQCQATVTSPTVTQVTIVHMPPVHITGNLGYCYGDVVQLSGDVGTGVAYQWYLDGAGDGITATVADGGVAVGDHTYQLVISAIDSIHHTAMCPETASVTVHIYDQPPAPVITGPLVIDCNSYHLQLSALEPLPGFYNWSDGNIGATDNIYAGGWYQVWFTSLGGCISSANVYVPRAPELSLQYFPTGCYDICRQQLPLTLYGPPDEPFINWEWLRGGPVLLSGSGVMSPYTLTMGGRYKWRLDNGLCAETSDTMSVNLDNCNDCPKAKLAARLSCESGNPASFSVSVDLYSSGAGTTYTIGTNIGPITPFSGTFPAAGPYTVTLTFTTLEVPAPSTVQVEVSYDIPGGTKCFQTVTVKVPSCTWVDERTADSTATPSVPLTDLNGIANALLVFPNPASGDMTISYDYGTDTYAEWSLEVYDMMGRKVETTLAGSTRGNWMLNIAGWTPGIYIVRMEGDGKTLQTQRVVVSH